MSTTHRSTGPQVHRDPHFLLRTWHSYSVHNPQVHRSTEMHASCYIHGIHILSTTHNPQVHRSTGPQVHRSTGPQVHRSSGPQVHRSTGPHFLLYAWYRHSPHFLLHTILDILASTKRFIGILYGAQPVDCWQRGSKGHLYVRLGIAKAKGRYYPCWTCFLEKDGLPKVNVVPERFTILW